MYFYENCVSSNVFIYTGVSRLSIIRCRPAVRISGFHPGDPGSIPGNGNVFTFVPFPNYASLFDQILRYISLFSTLVFPKLWLLPLLPFTSF